jgi:hypothetical protein
MAVEGDPGEVRLLIPDTGRQAGRLIVPDPTRLAPQCCTADGTRLVAFGLESREVYVRDLRAIRGQLQALGLDRDLPPHPPAGPGGRPEPLRVEVCEAGG